MARINITIPDDIASAARAAGLNISQVAASALVATLDRQAKVAELDRYLADLESENGPISREELRDAERWADQALPPLAAGAAGATQRRSA